jgi:Spy/CpxP family protein refolding chaperone
MKPLALVATLCVIAAAPLAAQDTTHARHPGHPGMGARPGRPGAMADDMMPMMREMMAPMMRVIAYTPDHLLAHKDSLQLTADQVTKLTALHDSAKSAHEAAAADFKTHMGELSEAFQGPSPDAAALQTHFDAAHAAMGKAHWSMLSAAARAKALLTNAQRQKVDAWVSAMARRERM